MGDEDAPSRRDDILSESHPRTYMDGASVTLRIGPMPDVTPITDTPADWQESEAWTRWEPPFAAVRGEDHHRATIDDLVGPSANGLYPTRADLVRDPNNQYDPNAIRVEAEQQLVGHVERALAAVVAPALDDASAPRLVVPAVIHADQRTDERHVWLWLRRRLSGGPKLAIPVEWADAHVVSAPDEVEAVDAMPVSDSVIDRYLALNSEAREAWSGRDLDRLLQAARGVLALLPEYVDAVRQQNEEQRAVLEGLGMEANPQQIRSEAFTLAGSVAAALGERDLLVAMRDEMQRGESPAETVSEMEGFLADEQSARRVLAFVADNPGTIQKDLYAKLGEDKSVVSTACYNLALVGLLRREKRGTSYELYVA